MVTLATGLFPLAVLIALLQTQERIIGVVKIKYPRSAILVGQTMAGRSRSRGPWQIRGTLTGPKITEKMEPVDSVRPHYRHDK